MWQKRVQPEPGTAHLKDGGGEPTHRRWRRRVAWWLMALVVAPLMGSALIVAAKDNPHWSAASHKATGQAPDPITFPDAVVQVYAARTWGWRGVFAVHTWIAVKRQGDLRYTRFEVIGWRSYYGRPPLKISHCRPDARWFSNRPDLLADIRGEAAAELIPQIEAAVAAYLFGDSYRTWPGPNSNTFTAFVTRRVAGLEVDFPVTAVGKDYLVNGDWIGTPPGGRGFQFSLNGYFGVLVGPEEGIEINLFGAAFGIDFNPLALKLPGLGRIG